MNTELIEKLRQACEHAETYGNGNIAASIIREILASLPSALESESSPHVVAVPVAWRCKDCDDRWIIFQNKKAAELYQKERDEMMEDPPSCPHGMMIGCKICAGHTDLP